MIAGLKGRIERKLDDAVLIDVGGVIYRINTSLVTLEDIGETGESARLFTHLYVREDQLTLYGFASPDELRLFETLISVSGVGPRLALAILSRVRPEALEKIFERFYTDRPEDQGFGQNSGLGLSISKQIVEAHGGRIWVENRVAPARDGEEPKVLGARFHVRLPAM